VIRPREQYGATRFDVFTKGEGLRTKDDLKMKPLFKTYQEKQIEDFVWWDDFTDGPDTTNKYTVTAPESGTAVLSATGGNGGVLVVTPDASAAANDEIYFFTKNNLFLPAFGQPCIARAAIQYTEVNTNQANIFFGFASAPASGLLVTGSGGMRTTGTILGLFKQGGTTVWQAIARNGSTVQNTTSTQAAGLSTYQNISVEVIDQTAGQCTVVFKVDDQILLDANENWIRFIVPYSGLVKCSLTLGLRNGATVTNGSEVVNLDWWIAQQRRNFGNYSVGP
jgi:hypothetical protein